MHCPATIRATAWAVILGGFGVVVLASAVALAAERYVVQAGRFADLDVAFRIADELRAAGYASYVLTLADEQGELTHSVRAALNQDFDEAQAMREQLEAKGFFPSIVREGELRKAAPPRAAAPEAAPEPLAAQTRRPRPAAPARDASPPPSRRPGRMVFVAQVGEHASMAQASQDVRRLKGLGHAPFVLTFFEDGRWRYLVLLERWDSYADARRQADALEQAGFDTPRVRSFNADIF